MSSVDARGSSTISLEENLKKALTELLILQLFSEREYYIGELTTTLNKRSGGRLTIVFPYGAIYRLEQSGYITVSGKKNAPDGRRRQYYIITKKGTAYLKGDKKAIITQVSQIDKSDPFTNLVFNTENIVNEIYSLSLNDPKLFVNEQNEKIIRI